MRKRLAALITIAGLLITGGVTATAYAAETNDETSTLSTTTYTKDDLKDVTVTYDGRTVDWDPTGDSITITIYKDESFDEDDASLFKFSNLPDGWLYSVISTSCISGVTADGTFLGERCDYALLLWAPDDTIFQYAIKYNEISRYSTDDLADITITYDGEPVDWDYSETFTTITIPTEDGEGDLSLISVGNLPDGWTWDTEAATKWHDSDLLWIFSDAYDVFTYYVEFTTAENDTETPSDEEETEDASNDENQTVPDESTDNDDMSANTDVNDDTNSTATTDDNATTTLAQTGVNTNVLPVIAIMLLLLAIGVGTARRRRV